MVFYIDENDNYNGTDDETNDQAERLGPSNDYDFTGSMDMDENENEDFHDIHDNAFEGNIYRGEFYPFKDKIHILIPGFYCKIGGDTSQSLMKRIMHLIEVIETKRDFLMSRYRFRTISLTSTKLSETKYRLLSLLNTRLSSILSKTSKRWRRSTSLP